MPNFNSLFYKPKKRTQSISKKRWRVFPIIWKALKRVCMVFGAMFLFSLIMMTISMSFLLKETTSPTLPKDMVLLLELEEGLSEIQSKSSFMEPFPFSKPTLRNVIQTLENAQKDDRVRGIVVSVKGGNVSVSHTQELRVALEKFKESGKFTKIYASSYGGSGNGLGLYHFAAGFDEIWMQPVGIVSISGMNIEMPFAKQALDKIGVHPDFLKREDYKSAMENLTNSSMSPANKEMMSSILRKLVTANGRTDCAR